MTNPITFPREGGCVYFRKAGLFGIMCANDLLASASAVGGGRQTQRKECQHGKANDTG